VLRSFRLVASSLLLLAAACSPRETTPADDLAARRQALDSDLTVHGSSWTLSRRIPFVDPQSAVFNGRDGLIYVGRRSASASPVDGLYKIAADGTATKVVNGDRLAALAVHHPSGNVFFSEDFGGVVYRVALGATLRQTWVSGFHAGDDDPVGIAIASETFAPGGAIAPGEAIVVDRGFDSPDEVSRFSPLSGSGASSLLGDTSALVDAVDVAIGSAGIFIVDPAEGAAGRVYRLDPDRSLVKLLDFAEVGDPTGIAADPLSDALFLLDQESGTLFRFNPVRGSVQPLISGFELRANGWSGVDVSPDGSQLVITSSTADELVVFTRDVTRVQIDTDSSLLRCEEGVSCPDIQLEASLGSEPYAWTLVSGELPAGVSLAPTGLISGQPARVGASAFTVRVTDAVGAFAEKSLQFEVAGPSFTVVEAGWSHAQTIVFQTDVGAVINPIDGKVYAVRTGGGSSNGLYRIEWDGSSSRVAPLSATFGAGGLAVNPTTGDLFASDPIAGAVHRLSLGGSTTQVWVSGFEDNADDDPFGLAIAPPGYSGGVVQPGEGILSDLGAGRPGHVFKFRSDLAQGESRIASDVDSITEPHDVSIGSLGVFLAQSGPPGRILRVNPDHSLTRFAPPIASPTGLVEDPARPSLLVLDGSSANRLVRFDPATGRTANVIVDLVRASPGGVDLSLDGSKLLVTDRGAGRIYLFERDVRRMTVAADPLRVASVGARLEDQLQAFLGQPPYTWTVVAGALPPGVGLSASGQLSGTPTELGDFAFTARATDSAGRFAEAELSKSVRLHPPPAEIQLSKHGTRTVRGRLAKWWILVENAGPAPATDVRVSELLDWWFVYGGSSPAPVAMQTVPQSFTNSSTVFDRVFSASWVFPVIAPGETKVITYSAALNPAVKDGQILNGTACKIPNPRHLCDQEFNAAREKSSELCKEAIAAIDDLDDVLDAQKYAQLLAAHLLRQEVSKNLGDLAAMLAENIQPSDLTDHEALCKNLALKVQDLELRRCRKLYDLEDEGGAYLKCRGTGPCDCEDDASVPQSPRDPNEKVSLAERFVRPEAVLPYVVHFENVSETTEARDVRVSARARAGSSDPGGAHRRRHCAAAAPGRKGDAAGAGEGSQRAPLQRGDAGRDGDRTLDRLAQREDPHSLVRAAQRGSGAEGQRRGAVPDPSGERPGLGHRDLQLGVDPLRLRGRAGHRAGEQRDRCGSAPLRAGADAPRAVRRRDDLALVDERSRGRGEVGVAVRLRRRRTVGRGALLGAGHGEAPRRDRPHLSLQLRRHRHRG
jgi:DNA-binding beta-propeller fold protein YncE